MTTKQLIVQLKEDLKACRFTVHMFEHYKLMQFAFDKETQQIFNRMENSKPYFEGVALIKQAITLGLYLETDAEFYKILKEILGPLSVVNKETYCRALTERDVVLGRSLKTLDEFHLYQANLEYITR